MTKSHILLIGAGQLGSRHLQGLALSTVDIDISVVDPSEASLKLTQERLAEVSLSPSIGSVNFYNDLQDVKGVVDCCIIATNAQYRLQILENLLSKLTVKSIVFEKVLFQSEAQIQKATALLAEKDIAAWVNCPRRMFPFYQHLKNHIGTVDALSLTATGNGWDMACNGIHLIDLWSYLSGSTNYTLETSGLLPHLISSKRAGYIEVEGVLTGAHAGHDFSLHCSRTDEPVSLHLTIETPTEVYCVDEMKGACSITNKVDGSERVETFSVLYQSQLSNVIVENILASGDCPLTTYADSAAIHRPFVEGLLTFINAHSDDTYAVCPIT